VDDVGGSLKKENLRDKKRLEEGGDLSKISLYRCWKTSDKRGGFVCAQDSKEESDERRDRQSFREESLSTEKKTNTSTAKEKDDRSPKSSDYSRDLYGRGIFFICYGKGKDKEFRKTTHFSVKKKKREIKRLHAGNASGGT